MDESIFSGLLNLLNENHVDYMVVGGYAVVVHGYRRFTGDLDIWFRAAPENAQRILDTLDAFGVGSLPISLADLLDTEGFVQFGRYPYRVDLLNTIAGITFEEAYANKVFILYEGISIPFIGLTDLIKNKEASGRPKDLKDAKQLKKKHKL
ncbi:MAG: DUF6036 family nucleotidyltransferase [Bacteroidia bacterium]|nr:DUF6036 family nucleotidyltransferase [Bacteroidia bacterium]